MTELILNKETIEELRNAYEAAERNFLPHFQFQGVTLVTAYAKYLLQYYEPIIFKKKQ